MNDKEKFDKKSKELIESFENQNRTLNNFLQRLKKEYKHKFDFEKEVNNDINDKNEVN